MSDRPSFWSGVCDRCGRKYSAVKIHWYDDSDREEGIVNCPFCDHEDERIVRELEEVEEA